MAYKMQWNSLKEVQADLNSCMNYIKQFIELYEHKPLDPAYRAYTEEGFKSFIRAYFELVNAYITFCLGELPNYSKYGTYRGYLKEVEHKGYLPNGSVEFLDMLRKLRNAKAHGYLLPEFDLLLNMFKDHEERFDKLCSFILSK